MKTTYAKFKLFFICSYMTDVKYVKNSKLLVRVIKYFQNMKTIIKLINHFRICQGFRGGSDGKESACSAGDLNSIPAWGRSLGGGNGCSPQCSCLENPMDRGR